MIDEIVLEGDLSDPDKPDGDIMETPDGHQYEMGTRHYCGHPDCPAHDPSLGEDND